MERNQSKYEKYFLSAKNRKEKKVERDFHTKAKKIF
jgi:hypothetical protein